MTRDPFREFIRLLIADALENLISNHQEPARTQELIMPKDTLTVSRIDDSDDNGPITDIVHRGKQIILPNGMTMEQGINALQRRIDYEGERSVFVRDIDVFPLDGAHALFCVLRRRFGWAQNVPTMTMFGPKPPAMIDVAVGMGKRTSVPWGKFALPAPLSGTMSPSATMKQGRFIFQVTCETIRRHEADIKALFDEVEQFLVDGSIYRGKAIAVRFFDNDGDALPMPEPDFISTDVDESQLTFNADVEAAIRTSLFTPIDRLEDLKRNGIPIKRGILLGGPYGTGKTLTARVAAKKCEAAGITFIYVRHARELAHSIQFARCYSKPAVVVFCEDIDTAVKGERNQQMNDILNTIDGVDTKDLPLITLLTTNHIEQMSRAMLRPGRLDAVINIPAPDVEAAEKLLRIYGNGSIPKNAKLRPVAEELAGAIPAVIAEVVKRAKLHQLAKQDPGTVIEELSAAALLEAATTMRAQRDLLGAKAESKVRG